MLSTWLCVRVAPLTFSILHITIQYSGMLSWPLFELSVEQRTSKLFIYITTALRFPTYMLFLRVPFSVFKEAAERDFPCLHGLFIL
jgi:hypothetical protein